MAGNKEKVTEVDAKGGRRVKGMTIVLAVSTIIAAILLMIIFGVFST